MKATCRWLLVAAAWGLTGAGVGADQNTPVKFTVTLETAVHVFSFDTSRMVARTPSDPRWAPMVRTVRGEAVYPDKVSARVLVVVPGDLGLSDNQLALTPPAPAARSGAGAAGRPVAMSSKLYWHSDTAQGPVASALTLDSRHAAPGAVGLGADWKQREDERARTASGWASLPDTAVGQGDYTLPAGSLTIPLGALLPALKVTAPTTMGGINPAEGLMVTWEPVPGARGYLVSALAIGGAIGSDKFSVVRWVSSTIQPPERAQRQYEPATTIADDVAAGILLPPTAVSCQIPAGIFPELGSLGSFSLTVVAVGDDFSEDRRGVALRGRIRSTWSGLEVAPRQGTGTSAPAPPAPGMPLPGVSG